jgi:polysaccharide biosynthesis protein PslG
MLKRVVHLVLLITIVSTLALVPQTGQAQQDARYFPETSHWLSGYFLEKWQNTPNAMAVLGLPISAPFEEESFTEPGTYYRVQYFERAVLEEHPENFGVADNQYYILGRLMGRLAAQGRENEAPFQPVADPGDGTWIAETQHTLRDTENARFRSFWEQNGALDVFGYPISEQFQEVNEADGQTYWVQYFERQRMEWHPELDTVLLGLLGNEYRDAHHQDNPAFAPESPDNPPAGTTPPAPQPDTPAPAPQPNAPEDFIYGYNATLYLDGADWQDRERVLTLSKNSLVYWIRQQVTWRNIEDESGAYYWDELDDIVQDSYDAGIKLLLVVGQSPSWYTPNGSHGLPTRAHFADFANFMGAMAARYQGRVQAYEIWNEQNRACENGGDCQTAGGIGGEVASADYYVDMLAAAYDAVKANDPNAIVVSGAPTSTETNDPAIAISDITFIKQMLQNPNFRADIVGVHPGGHNNPPDSFWPDNPGPGEWTTNREFYFRRIEDVHQAMVDAGRGDMKMWVTEFGWATANTTPGYEYGNELSLEKQAEWIVRAFQKGHYEYPWVSGMFLWNLNFSVAWAGEHGDPTHEQASFSVLNPDWSPRPAWHAIQAMRAGQQ